jgi:hypothetical protein
VPEGTTDIQERTAIATASVITVGVHEPDFKMCPFRLM